MLFRSIGWALAYPERPPLPMVKRLDLFATELTFHKPDTETFRCLALAEEAGRKAAIVELEAAASAVSRARPAGWPQAARGAEAGASAAAGPRTVAAPIVLNAANEVAVQAFLDERVRFTDIHRINQSTLEALSGRFERPRSLEDLLELDARARSHATTAAVKVLAP